MAQDIFQIDAFTEQKAVTPISRPETTTEETVIGEKISAVHNNLCATFYLD